MDYKEVLVNYVKQVGLDAYHLSELIGDGSKEMWEDILSGKRKLKDWQYHLLAAFLSWYLHNQKEIVVEDYTDIHTKYRDVLWFDIQQSDFGSYEIVAHLNDGTVEYLCFSEDLERIERTLHMIELFRFTPGRVLHLRADQDEDLDHLISENYKLVEEYDLTVDKDEPKNWPFFNNFLHSETKSWAERFEVEETLREFARDEMLFEIERVEPKYTMEQDEETGTIKIHVRWEHE